MINTNFIFFLCMITAIISVNKALNTESLRGGKYVRNPKYRVSVQTRRPFQPNYIAICSGGIITKRFIISIAYCYAGINGNLFDTSVSIVAGTSNLLISNPERINVELIYLPDFEDDGFDVLAVALLQLAEDLDVLRYPHLVLPTRGEFEGETATVAGFGLNHVVTQIDPMTGQRYQAGGTSSFILTRAYVLISDYQNNYGLLINNNQMCGIMLQGQNRQKRGICRGDGGAPLVISGVVIGVASINRIDCDDTIVGSLYTKVLPYVNFINSIIINGTVPMDAIVHRVPLYIL